MTVTNHYDSSVNGYLQWNFVFSWPATMCIIVMVRVVRPSVCLLSHGNTSLTKRVGHMVTRKVEY